MNKSGDIHCLSKESNTLMFKLLDEQELAELNKNGFELKFKPGDIIRKQGAYLSHVIFVSSGLVSLYIEGLHDLNLILKIVKKGGFIGGPGMFVHYRHHYTVKSITSSEACFIDVKVFKSMIHTNPSFAEEFFKDFSTNTLSTYSRLINLTQRYVPGRLAEALLYLSEEIFNSRKFDTVLSSRELAALAGMSVDSVVKTLREFRKNGFIAQQKNTLEILNVEGLKEITISA